ncbi:MAG: ABC transporter ATP-binding protein [Limnohabitans sp.]|nr:ABC transporter ATP-binding protein [Limnohabitans sp.]
MNAPEAASAVPRLQVRDLTTTLVQREGAVPLVRGVSFDLHAGQTLALVGESGSGKSLTALSLMRLLARNARWQCGGQALFTDAAGQTRDVLQLSEAEMRQLRGHQMAMIFQEPMTCLNPVLTVGEQIAESVRLHWGLDKHAARQRALQALEQVEIPAARQRLDEYPHQLSGGMRQRVMIAMAMVCEPQVLIADEPTTALDVTIQAQILALMSRLQRDTGMSMLFITHNLGVVAHHAERVAVMYAGQVVEQAGVHSLFAQPAHPYTQGLLACLPGRARQRSLQEGRRMALQDIPGQAPAMDRLGAGCSFAERCASRLPVCSLQAPVWQGDAAHAQACHLERRS